MPVDLLLFRGQVVEVHLRRRRQGLDDIFERVAIDPVEKVEDLDRYLRVRKEQGVDVPLFQVLRDRIIVGEIPVVN